MSLINDALKRANAQKASPPGATPEDGARMLPAVREESSGSNPILLYVGVCLIALAVVVFALSFGLRRTPVQTAENSTPAPATNAAASLPTDVLTPIPSTPAAQGPTREQLERARAAIAQVETASPAVPQPQPVSSTPVGMEVITPTAAAPSAATPTPVATATPAPAAAPPVATPPGFPALKLQAVYYRMKGPTVVIDGKTLRVGDRISEARVVSIERMRVEMDWQGERRWLSLQ